MADNGYEALGPGVVVAAPPPPLPNITQAPVEAPKADTTTTSEAKPSKISKVQTVRGASSEMEHLEDEPRSRPGTSDTLTMAGIGLITLIVTVTSLPILLTGFGVTDLLAEPLKGYDGFLLFFFK